HGPAVRTGNADGRTGQSPHALLHGPSGRCRRISEIPEGWWQSRLQEARRKMKNSQVLSGTQRWPTGLSTMGRCLSVNAKRFPGKIALSHLEGLLTYRELNERVNQLANRLIAVGV